MKNIITFCECLAWAGIGFMVGSIISEWYIESLTGMGGTVLSSEILGAKLTPFILALFCGYGWYRLKEN